MCGIPRIVQTSEAIRNEGEILGYAIHKTSDVRFVRSARLFRVTLPTDSQIRISGAGQHHELQIAKLED